MAESFFSKLDPLTLFGLTAPKTDTRKHTTPMRAPVDNPGNDSYFSSLSSWWSKPWGSSIGEAFSNIGWGITTPLIPIFVLAIIGGVIALKILNKLQR